MSSLETQVIIVTGASSGLGEQLARALAAAGATPVLAARRAERLARLERELPGVHTVACDVTDAGDRERLVETVIDRHGRLDGLVNNAGVGATAPALKTSTEAFARVLDVNLTAPFALSCLAASRMRANGGGVDRQRRVGDGPPLDRPDPRRGLCRVEGGHDRPHARAGLAVGPLRHPRQRRRSRASSPPR